MSIHIAYGCFLKKRKKFQKKFSPMQNDIFYRLLKFGREAHTHLNGHGRVVSSRKCNKLRRPFIPFLTIYETGLLTPCKFVKI